MEKINFFESYINNMKNEQLTNGLNDNNIIDLLNQLSKIDPKCISEDGYEKLIKYIPLSPITYSEQVLAAGCNVIASLCSDDLARHYFGVKGIVATVNVLKSLVSRMVKKESNQKCLLQTCRAVGNLCYYHGENTKHALEEGCLLITMEVLKNNSDNNLHPVLIGLLLNLTHLDDYDYNFPDNMIEDLNFFGIQCIENNTNNYKSFINLISVMINIVRKSSSNIKVTVYEKCSFVDYLLENYSTDINIASICVKFIKQVSKTYNVYNWILKEKHKGLVKILDKYEENHEDVAKPVIKKICDIIILLSNDDGSMDSNKHLEVLYLVEWLLLKVHSNNLYIKLSAVRSLANFSRFKYESSNTTSNPAKIILQHMPWFINTLEKSANDKNSLMEVSILCLFKNLLYVTNFKSMDENDKDKLIKTTIQVLSHTSFNPIAMKSLDVIGCIIKKGGISQNHLILYKNTTFIKLVTTYCNNRDEEICILAKKLLCCINEDISTSETDVLHSVKNNLQIKD